MKRSLPFVLLLICLLRPYAVMSQDTRIWGTYYGGTGYESGNSVAIDPSGNIYVGGVTSTTVNMASGGFQNTYGGGTSDALLIKFDANGNRLWATYYGGTDHDNIYALTTDSRGMFMSPAKRAAAPALRRAAFRMYTAAATTMLSS